MLVISSPSSYSYSYYYSWIDWGGELCERLFLNDSAISSSICYYSLKEYFGGFTDFDFEFVYNY